MKTNCANTKTASSSASASENGDGDGGKTAQPVALLMKEGYNKDGFVIKLAVIASLSGLLFGYDTGVVSGAIIFLRPEMELSDLEIEIVVASTILTAALSATMGHHLMDSKGRKATLVIASIVFIVGSVIMACAFGPHKGYPMLVAGRLLVGVAIGLASDAGPLYISECAPPPLRGSLTTLFNAAVVGGQVFASIVCGCFSYLPMAYNWRLMMAFGAIPALAQMIGFTQLPLSPSWLILKGREEEAESVLRKIYGTPKYNVIYGVDQHGEDDEIPPSQQQQQQDDTIAKKEEDEIDKAIREIKEEQEIAIKNQHVGLGQLWWSNPPMRRMMILGCTLWAVSQLAGINTIMYYGASIIRRTGIEGDRSFDIWITVPLNAMQLIGIRVCYSIIDKHGRRWTLLLSMGLVFLSLSLIGIGFVIDSAALTVAAMCLYLFSFGVGLSTMPYTVNAEIYPTEYRGVCVAQATGVFWTSNFLVSLTFLTLAHEWGNAGVFFSYATIVLASGVVFYFKVPETAGRTLSEIQALFADEKAKPVYGEIEILPDPALSRVTSTTGSDNGPPTTPTTQDYGSIRQDNEGTKHIV